LPQKKISQTFKSILDLVIDAPKKKSQKLTQPDLDSEVAVAKMILSFFMAKTSTVR